MISARRVPAPDARTLRAAGLAALAEGGIIALPAHVIVTETGGARVGTAAFVLPFLALFAGSVLLVCRFRASGRTPTVAAIAGIAVGLWFGRGDPNLAIFSVLIALLVALRVVTLGLRDWRDPIHGEIGWGATALGAETLLATGSQRDWVPLLTILGPLFFVCCLASRATTVWTTGGAEDLDEDVRAAWLRRAVAAAAGLAVAMVVAVALGIRGGVFDRIGALLTPIANAVGEVVAFVLTQLARPIFWLVERLNIDAEGVRNLLESLRRRLEASRDLAPGSGAGSMWQRLLGLLLFGLFAFLIARWIRRIRGPRIATERSRPVPGTAVAVALPAEAAPSGAHGGFGRELPADRVRRFYAETLIDLERARLPKDPSLTPGEFEPDVATAFPACSRSFAELTRAYEDVRYGGRHLGERELTEVELHRRAIARALRRVPPHRPSVPDDP